MLRSLADLQDRPYLQLGKLFCPVVCRIIRANRIYLDTCLFGGTPILLCDLVQPILKNLWISLDEWFEESNRFASFGQSFFPTLEGTECHPKTVETTREKWKKGVWMRLAKTIANLYGCMKSGQRLFW